MVKFCLIVYSFPQHSGIVLIQEQKCNKVSHKKPFKNIRDAEIFSAHFEKSKIVGVKFYS